jgi:hypothetical protein
MKIHPIYLFVLCLMITCTGLAQLQLPGSDWEFVCVYPDSTSVTRSAHGLAVDNEDQLENNQEIKSWDI